MLQKRKVFTIKMEMFPPKLRLISTWADSARDKHEEMWEIYTPEKKSLFWSILMSYLFSSSRKLISQNLRQLIELLQDKNDDHGTESLLRNNCSYNKIQALVFRFNPFKNHRTFYSADIMKCILETFKKKLLSGVKSEAKEKLDNEKVLVSASILLNSCIKVYDNACENNICVQSSEINRVGCQFMRTLILFRTCGNSTHFDTFNFGMHPFDACLLRKRAFQYIAAAAEIPHDIMIKLKGIITPKSDFLIRLVYTKNPSLLYIVNELYKSPFMIQKLLNAGINMDPRKIDEQGLSVFYHCMFSNEVDFMRVLYNYAANNTFTEEDNIRKPNSNILEAIKEIGSIIRTDCLKSENFSCRGCCKDSVMQLCHQLLRFNEYQYEIVREIIEIKKTETDVTAKQQKIMISILDYYYEYFLFEISEEDPFRNYIKFSEYYDMLDNFTYLLFFDNFTSIIPMVTEDNLSVFTNAVRSLFLSVIANKLFPRQPQEETFYNRTQNFQNEIRFIPFLYRNEFRTVSIVLSRELKESLKLQRKPSTKIIDVIRKSLCGLPEIENELIATRFSNYLSIIVRSVPEISNPKNVLAMERIIQVIGELICNEDVNECVPRFLMCSCLPNEIESVFCKLRNHCFSHYRASSVEGRINLEYNQFQLNSRIQNEICNLYHIMQPIVTSLQLKTKEFMMEKGKAESNKKYKDVCRYIHRKQLNMFRFKKALFEHNQKDYGILSRNMLRYLTDSLEKRMTINERQGSFFKVKDMQGMFKALFHLSNYISMSLKYNGNYGSHLIANSNKLKRFIEINSEKPIIEVKEDIKGILQETSLIYNDIFTDIEISCDTKKGTMFNREIKSTYTTILRFLLHCYGTKKKQKEQIKFSQEDIKLLKLFDEKLLNIEVLPSLESQSEILIAYTNKLKILHKIIFESLSTNDKYFVLEDLELLLKAIKKSSLNEIYFDSNLINNYFHEMKDYDIFSSRDIQKINDSIVQYLMISTENKRHLENYLQALLDKRNILNNKYIEDILNSIVMPEGNRKDIINQINKSNLEKALKILKSHESEAIIFEPGKNGTKFLQQLSRKEEYRTMLLRIVFHPRLRKKVHQVVMAKFYFFLNRIDEMKKILIYDDLQIKNLWTKGKSQGIKHHTKLLMCQKYVRERDTRASPEMLLLDCFNILEDKKVKDFWQKKTNLFSGANLRDFLAHGSPVIEVIGGLLDPNDLPMEFINKILQLINDKAILCALLELWKKVKLNKIKAFRDLIDKECNDEYSYLRNQIKVSNLTKSNEDKSEWEKYLKLLPLEM